MRIITSFAIVTALLFSTSCGNSKKIKNNKEEEKVEESSTGISAYPNYSVDYLASSEDRSWYVSIEYEEQVIFYDKNEKIEFSALESTLEVAAGANIVVVHAENAVYKIQITIDVNECNKNGRKVDIVLNRFHDKKEFTYSGCGQYRGKPQLHDIWALVEVNGKKLSPDLFPHEFPHFEFDLAQQKMSGFAGCNQVNGSLHFGFRNMIIEPLISTRMYCSETSQIENEILNILRNKPTYHIKDLKLYIETPEGSIILKKVD